MVLRVPNNVKETTTDGGPGNLGLLGPEEGYNSFSEVGANNQVYYRVEDGEGLAEWGEGTWLTGPSRLQRDRGIGNSLGTSAILDWTPGVLKTVTAVAPDELLASMAGRAMIATTAGSASALTLALPVTLRALKDGAIAFARLAVSPTTGATLNVDGTGAKEIRKGSGALQIITGDLISGALIMLVYNATLDKWIIVSDISTRLLLAVLIASGSTSLDFTGDMTLFSRIELEFKALRPSTDAQELRLRVDVGAGFLTSGYSSDYIVIPGATPVGGSSSAVSLSGSIGNAAGEGVSGDAVIENPSDTARPKAVKGDVERFNASGALSRELSIGSYNGSNAAVVGLRLIMATGNIADGSCKVYGAR